MGSLGTPSPAALLMFSCRKETGRMEPGLEAGDCLFLQC